MSTNLVKNAIKYTNEGAIDFDTVKTVEFFKRYWYRIPIEQQSVFERFIQVDIENIQRGTRFRLAISKAFVQLWVVKFGLKARKE
jgi:signal transduction histidine kinase